MKLIFLIAAVLSCSSAFAQTLVPATSEDIDQFDRQLSQAREKRERAADSDKDKKAKKDNFGKIVSAEAKRLKEADDDSKKDFGNWVGSQRRRNDDGRPDPTGASGKHGGDDSGAAGAAVGAGTSGKSPSSSEGRGSSGGSGSNSGPGNSHGNGNGNGRGKN